MSQYVLLKDLAEEWGIDRSVARRWVLRHGFKPVKIVTPDTRGKKALAFTKEDAEDVRKYRQNYYYVAGEEDNISNDFQNGGVFYAIQLIPELDPCRIKLGFTGNIEARLLSHKTVAPTACVLKTWPCKRIWERAAIESITRLECTPLSSEVYIFPGLEDMVGRGDTFFDLMPEITSLIGE